MCGISGFVSLGLEEAAALEILEPMRTSLSHRGPDDAARHWSSGVALASNRLSLVDLAGGKQPIFNEDRSVRCLFNGEIFNHKDLRSDLAAKGHGFRSESDGEVIPHLWEEERADGFPRLSGQFALAIHDQRQRTLVLARDRYGICPLFWTTVRHENAYVLLFASEIKALLASGLLRPEPDLEGIKASLTMMAAPAPRTCFRGIRSLSPGCYLEIPLTDEALREVPAERAYWFLDFPRKGEESIDLNPESVARMEALMQRAVRIRMQSDVPAAAFLSGGVDSSLVAAYAQEVSGGTTPTFSSGVAGAAWDESDAARFTASHISSVLTIDRYRPEDVARSYPALIGAAECPVTDLASAALLNVTKRVAGAGYKFALCGQGSDELFAGYPWFKIQNLLSLPGSQGRAPSRAVGYALHTSLSRGPSDRRAAVRDAEAFGHLRAFGLLFTIFALAGRGLWSGDFKAATDAWHPLDDLRGVPDDYALWHPLNQSLYWGLRTFLPSHLLAGKGDRVGMHNSVETRYPFLDDDVVDFTRALTPRAKFRRLQDKVVLRQVAERRLPRKIAWRRKKMFRAPSTGLFSGESPRWLMDLLSDVSLRKTNYFESDRVRALVKSKRRSGGTIFTRSATDIALAGVVATQLWHHTFIDGTLADLPSQSPTLRVGAG